MAIYLNDKERRALGQRKPREEVVCPVCGGKAERQRNGDWTCVAFEKMTGWGALRMSILTCGARGVTIDDELLILSQPAKADDEDSRVSDGS